MDLQYNNPNEHGRNEQIVSQFLLKSLHIVLQSRVPSIGNGNGPITTSTSGHRGNLQSQSDSQVKKSDKWFNLALGERPSPTGLDSLKFWHRNIMEPMMIDIILVQEMGMGTRSGYGALVETVIERWVVQYEYEYSRTSASSSEFYKKTYKKSIILLRSLYTMMRLLPAYRAYRKLLCISSSEGEGKGKGKGCGFDINYRVSSFSAPFTRAEEESMKHYSFFPIEAHHGRLSISVKYRESLADFNLETSASFPPEIITDYVGSPATDPFRAFHFPVMNRVGVNVNANAATSFPSSAAAPPPQRPHSWTSGLSRGAPFTHNQYSSGSTPPHRSSSGRYDSLTDVYGPNYRPPSFDDYQLSPPFSPSPPTYLPIQSRLHSETAPVSIPMINRTPSPRYLSPNLSDPANRHLPPPSPRRYDHESPSGIRSLKKSDMSRIGIGDLSSGSGSGSANHYSSHNPKVVSRDNKDDSGRFSGLLSSSGSPRVGFSRSSSKLSLQDELDDIDFSCPFIVDDVDTCDSSLNVSESGGKQAGRELSKKSQDAAVGALVRMLRTAPPLRQDSSCYSLSTSRYALEEPEFNNSNSGLFLSRKTSDALEELKAYTDIKDLILSKSGTRFLSKEQPL
ncbi:autophagy-related protein 13a [Lactuca sativa]|uniref:Autophagy-related protein 13 N-terminal domain-containing protein n=1 Tax=Lactuca sativa TaxID=4236 RepID=A0A9R1WDX0_LACSA|nr:autophagy-related protein 13a [Lactuca sativa]XP_023771925.1 autophagy-related protein 13a [Lactuca sativa]XP_023771928.1 autophagy-related protein 13a [Lactuca sativa]KAJ0223385.1 hypothetical protein LSAT_V11C200101160 [Lactuca sativa]